MVSSCEMPSSPYASYPYALSLHSLATAFPHQSSSHQSSSHLFLEIGKLIETKSSLCSLIPPT